MTTKKKTTTSTTTTQTGFSWIRYVKVVDCPGKGQSMRALIQLLKDLKVDTTTQRLVMNKTIGMKQGEYMIEMYTNVW